MKPIYWKTIKEYEDILFDYCDGIAKITINRPQVYNAFRPQTNCEMLDAMSICRERSDIGVIILTGAGDKAFCSGGDQNVKGIWICIKLYVPFPSRLSLWSTVMRSEADMCCMWYVI